jgi:hypothetical protein
LGDFWELSGLGSRQVTGKYSKTAVSALIVYLGVFTAVSSAQESQLSLLQPQSLNKAGVYSLRQIDPSLTGEGVKFAVICRSYTYLDGQPQNDYRPFVGHNSLITNRFSFHDEALMPAGVSPHSTAVCSILFGMDTQAYNPKVGNIFYEGVVPEAQVDIYEFIHFLCNNICSQVTPDADILTADFGQQFEAWWTRGIESLAQKEGIIVVAGIGNGKDARDPVLYPAAGANVIGVGVVDSVKAENNSISLAEFALANPEHSSLGPTAGGMCKPDIVAPGNSLAAVAGRPDGYESTGDFSSFSTPVVAGVVGLLVQKARQDPSMSNAVKTDGWNCLIKAILLNSAIKLPYWHKGSLQKADDHIVPLDYVQGAGMVNAVGAYENLDAGRQNPGQVSENGWDINQINKNTTNIYKLNIEEPSDKIITITLAWNMHYKNVYPFLPDKEKNSNLRLELWAVDLLNPSNSLLLDYSDSMLDNVEHIYIASKSGYNNYEIVITNSDNNQEQIPQSQPYGLAWNVSEQQQQDSILWYDLNADGIVNNSDVTIMLINMLESTKSSNIYTQGDINHDGVINAKDVNLLLLHNNQQTNWYNE